jgi:succinyl-diaminopimelate desuccinylase
MLLESMISPPVSSMAQMAQELIRIPSRAGIDNYGPIVERITQWLSSLGISHQLLSSAAGTPVAVVAALHGDKPGPSYVLNATFDTAPFGDVMAWELTPTSGEIIDGWMYGRGSADSKAGIALFSHVVADVRESAGAGLAGTLFLLFDGDEHSGNFSGARAFFEGSGIARDIGGVMIGYPGNDRIVIGSRGFLRVHVTVRGEGAHSGSGSGAGDNAIVRAIPVLEAIVTRPLPDSTDDSFLRPPKVTITSIEGGEGFSQVPDLCRIGVDLRLTPTFGAEQAREWLDNAIRTVDDPETRALTDVEVLDQRAAYRVPENLTFVKALARAGEEVFTRSIPLEVTGPSNIGNYLAERNIPATAGFGVTYENLHAPNERFEIASLGLLFRAYERALRSLLVPSTMTDTA